MMEKEDVEVEKGEEEEDAYFDGIHRLFIFFTSSILLFDYARMSYQLTKKRNQGTEREMEGNS